MSQILNGTNDNGSSFIDSRWEGEVTPAAVGKSAATSPILEKCARFTRAEEMRSLGLYPYFRTIESAQDTEVVIDGRPMLMMGSNSYLGLTNDPRIKEATKRAVDEYGSGCAGSRFLNGTLSIHVELEEMIADLMEKDAALVFTTGYQANLGAIAALASREDHLFIDRTDHASIVDAARLGFGKVHKFQHNDAQDLDRMMAKAPSGGKMVVVDGVYSMEGDIVCLPEIVEVAQKHRAAILVDDAHSIGVLGRTGNGTADHFGLSDQVDLIGGTFSKSLASIGGFVAADRDVIDYLKHHARALIFSASMAPACVAAARAAIEIMISEPERIQRLWENTRFLHHELKGMGLDTGASQSPIIPLVIGSVEDCFRFWRALHDAGVFVNPVVPPATPSTRSLIRLSVMATHARAQLEQALEAIEKVSRSMDMLSTA